MGGDLGMGMREVHENAVAVLDFWFGLPPAKHFEKDGALDAEIAARFGAMRDSVVASGAEAWREDEDMLLAAIILLDQFSRNIHRGTAEAFAADPLARSLTQAMIEKGLDRNLTPERRVFAYMPLMHAEDSAIQALSIEKFAALGIANNIEFARAHNDVIDRFGRFPSRNAALGRRSTPQEEEYLSQPGAGW